MQHFYYTNRMKQLHIYRELKVNCAACILIYQIWQLSLHVCGWKTCWLNQINIHFKPREAQITGSENSDMCGITKWSASIIMIC